MIKLVSLCLYLPCAFVTVFPGQFPVCWLSPVSPLKTVLFPTFGVKLNPMFGAAAMSLSSVCVVVNALRLKFFRTDYHARDIEEPNQNGTDIKEDKGMKAVLKIEGMMCEHCKKHVEDALNGMAGVTAVVDLAGKSATVAMEQDITDDTFAAVIKDAGYELTGVTR